MIRGVSTSAAVERHGRAETPRLTSRGRLPAVDNFIQAMAEDEVREEGQDTPAAEEAEETETGSDVEETEEGSDESEEDSEDEGEEGDE